MSAPFKNTGSIKWTSLDKKLIDYWYRKALSTDKMEKFIFSWIILNHYYVSYTVDCPDPSWKKDIDKMSEREQIDHFISFALHKNIWPDFVKLHNVKKEMQLPLLDRKGRKVPSDIPAGKTKLITIGYANFIKVMYQIRCQFIHGQKGCNSFEDQNMLVFAAEPLFEYVKKIIQNTPPSSNQ